MAFEGDIQGFLAPTVGGRCFPIVNPSTSIVYPYATFQVISKIPNADLEGVTGLTFCRLQIDAFAKSYGGAKAVAESIKAAMAAETINGLLVFSFDQYESEVDNYRVILEYELWIEE